MTESVEWQGTWFIEMPYGSEIVFSGILSYDLSSGCILKAFTDEISDEHLDHIYSSNRIDIIYGYENIHHSGITLKKCVVTNALKGEGLSISFTVTEIIENLHYENKSSLEFDKVHIEFSAFSKWLDNNNTEIKFYHEYDLSIKYSFTYKQPDVLIFNINDGFDIKFINSYSMTKSNKNRQGNFFTEKDQCYIISKKGKVSVDELDRYSEHFRRLLALLYHQYCFAINYAYVNNKIYISYNKYYHQKGFDNPNNYPTYGGILVKYKVVKDNLESIIQNWFIYRESSDMTYVTYIASKSISSFSEETFLENVRALEVYDKVKNKIKINFRQRMTNLLENIKKVSDDITVRNFILDIDRFVHLVVENRNYLTHYGDGSISIADELEIPELLVITRKCKIILITSLMEDLGINPSICFDQLVNKYNYLIKSIK